MSKHYVTECAKNTLDLLFPEHELQGKKILVGLSGGADSVTLTRVLCELSDEYGFSVAACHINHMIRKGEADRDEAFARELCERLGIPFHCKRIDIPEISKRDKKGLEETARNARYEYFDKLCRSIDADYIATAHTASDNAETVIFNMIRGCGVAGLCGIPKRRGNIIRPLILATRSDIESYIREIGESYVTDSTNLEDDCTRNIIRHRIVPEMCGINPSFHRSVSRLSDISFSENAFLDRLAKESYTDDIAELAKLDPVIRSRVIGLMYKGISGNMPENSHLKRLCDEIEKYSKSGKGEAKRFCLPGNITAELMCGRLYMEIAADTDNNTDLEYDILPVEGINILCGGKILVIYNRKCDNNEKISPKIEYNKNIYSLFMETKLFSDIISGNICLRSGKSGDKIRISGMSKSIKKMYSAKKIPIPERNILPRIYDSGTGEILSLPYVGLCDAQTEVSDMADISIQLYKLCTKE